MDCDTHHYTGTPWETPFQKWTVRVQVEFSLELRRGERVFLSWDPVPRLYSATLRQFFCSGKLKNAMPSADT